MCGAHCSCNAVSYNIRSRLWKRVGRIRDKRERCLQPDKFAAMPYWIAAENVGLPPGPCIKRLVSHTARMPR